MTADYTWRGIALPIVDVSEHFATAILAKENGMPRLATLSEINRQAMLSFPCLEPDTTSWSPFGKPLSQAKISLVTSAGLHLRHDQPFIGDPKSGDTSFGGCTSAPVHPVWHRRTERQHCA